MNFSSRQLMFFYALSIEDMEVAAEYKKYTRKDVEVEKSSNQYYSVELKHYLSPRSAEQCQVVLTRGKLKFSGIIDQIKSGRVYFEIKPKFDCDLLYDLHIVPNRVPIIHCQNAGEFARTKNLIEYLEKFEKAPAKQKYNAKTNFDVLDFDWYNENISSNAEQKMAVKNIVNCTAFPFPFVVFGPPGTGKTTTLVEAVLQIFKMKPGSKILVTCQSNSACDVIGTRLLKFLSRSKIFRWYSTRSLENFDKLSESLRSTSNIRHNRIETPSYEELKTFDVVITTLVTSKKLHRAMISRDYFDYMFIDECASTIEPECLIPITGLGSTMENITSNIVLFGDHKQLGPILQSRDAEAMGLGKICIFLEYSQKFQSCSYLLAESLLERIMKQKKYLANPNYNNNYVVQLLDNFRSHQAILHFSNTEFYDSKLRTKGPREVINTAINWKVMPNPKFPIIFHSVLQASTKEKNCTSSYNAAEVDVVSRYVECLLKYGVNGKKVDDRDIGILTPYRGQLSLLQKIQEKHPNIEIGVTECYQGREKDIMIITTVKSKENIGFLKNNKRLNVSLTRAKYLMIVVGNPVTLLQDPCWAKFIGYCRNNGAFTGEVTENLKNDKVAKDILDIDKLSIK